MIDTTILGAFEDPANPACHDCLAGMVGQLKLVDGSMIDCGIVIAGCGAKDQYCASNVDCIDAYLTAHPSVPSLDCAFDPCLGTTSPFADFSYCAADRCGKECKLTVGFTTTGCP